ncbi:AAA family ATPase [Trichormus variabilis]|uniref:Serine/threonine protein kinase n=1 Tax=Trichormus variabilis SAG 1403-4b TaxID=447716 RepID=A0A3S5K2Z2_ANAVA|nr:AAA family ATPase [Trichormus variabilis]MBD2628649.1 AAA family ATPase [Trichormus variabilis FACHB-164]RUS94760.1 serine/threonine protein kinase [Trichormus variabilis SAG 1403-4b]
MFTVPGISIQTQIYESNNSLVYRGKTEKDNQPIILKVLKDNYPTPQELARYHTEYEITKSLNLTGVVKVYNLQKYQNTLVMSIEDFGGESLRIWMQQKSFTLEEFLKIAITTTETLGQIHAANIIHKDINPSNIVLNTETSEIKIIDFSISTKLNRENPTIKNPHVLEGTLAYMSPEQTGRMNRSLDYRTDFYSLGVTLYELLTNKLPFATNDALELVHCHIAKQPLHISEINPDIPPVIANIVMKLMAKTAEERYQSALGIKTDLEECLKQLQSHGRISNFVIANQDISDKFQLPQKLYGREREINSLITAFERVTFQNEMILIAGYSGIGKTALVQEIYKPITQKRGYFISGKFDQYQRNIPYSAVVIAFQALVKQLLTEREEKLKEWREKLLAALGINGQIIIEVIPEVELIIGKQPTVIELGLTETQNRFNLVFQNFIKVFTKPEHPLAIFLDDLQWADGASLKLMQLLMSAGSPGLFLIGAYRDNEVSAVHPLMLTLEEIGKTGVIINRIFLSPLNLDTVTEIIADTLRNQPENVRNLAKLVQIKTEGNPFFINEFLKSLATEQLLKFDIRSLSWQWDLKQIQQRNFTDNVVELMAGKIKNLPENTQELLKFSACIGNQFDIINLALLTKQSFREIVDNLQPAINYNLIVSFDSNEEIELALLNPESNQYPLPEYKFTHDRIQQATYSLISEAEKPIIHQKIGKILLQNSFNEQQEDKIFDIVNQLNFTLSLLVNQSEKNELVKLNLKAGKKAKASVAYQSALTYLQIGIQLLGDDRWQKQYELSLSLYQEAVESAYFNSNFILMDQLINEALLQVKNVLDQVKFYEIKILAYIAQYNLNEANNQGLAVIKLLGIKLPKKLNKLNIFWEFLQTKLITANKSISSLEHLPQMSDIHAQTVMGISSTIISTSYSTDLLVFLLMVFQQVRLSIKLGNTAQSAFAYSCYGLFLCGLIEDIEGGFQFGQLALKLLSQIQYQKVTARTKMIVELFIRPWKDSIKEILPSIKEVYHIGLENGDIEYAVYSAYFYCSYAFFGGLSLTVLAEEMNFYTQQMIKMKQERVIDGQKLYHQIVLNLLDKQKNPCTLIGSVYNEELNLPIIKNQNDHHALANYYVNKLMLFYLFGEIEKALTNGRFAQEHLEGITSSYTITYFYFYDALACLAYLTYSPLSEHKKLINKVLAYHKKMKKWAHYAPINYLHKYLLVEAELCRIQGKNSQAIDYYDQAISLSKENEYIHEAALAYELAAKFYLCQGKELTAKAYMQEARYCYQMWGAEAKVKHLEKNYAQLLTTITGRIKDIKTATNITTTDSAATLDIATVMKATQAISGEIMLDKLLSSLMKILIENVGAQTGYLILFYQEKLLIEAEGSINSEDVTFLQSLPVSNCKILSEAIVNYVARTKETVVLNDATRAGNFTSDHYIQTVKPKSILCVPLINQSKLISIVYLENNLTTGAFTSERVEVLNLLSAQAAISIENARLYNEMAKLNQAYERFVPRQFLQFLNKSSIVDVKLGDQVQLEMSVLFSDIRDFTQLSESMTPEDNFKFINSYLSRMEPIITENNGFIDKYIGDAIMALFSGEADNAVKAAIAMLQLLIEYNTIRGRPNRPELKIGIGINTGSLMLGTVGGQNRMDGTVISDAVNLASRVENLTKNYGVSLLITEQTYSRLKNPSNYDMRIIDTVKVKGKSQAVTVYEVFDADLAEIKNQKLATLPIFTEALSLYNHSKLEDAARLFTYCLQKNPGDRVAHIYCQRCLRPT